MVRHFDNWLSAFMEYASYSEAPRHMHFWTGVSTLAGALRRQVWLDQAYFRWYPNFYIILVAPPGIVSKSTTAGMGMELLRQVPDIRFGPDVVTWQALVTSFAESSSAFEYQGEFHTQSPITIESSEFGNLLNPQDKEMVDLLVNMWDCKPGAFTKKTKHSGSDEVINPWVNIIACTTPSWIAGNFPEYMVGGGFTSRCLFVYAENKAKFVAYPGLEVPGNLANMATKLIHDLSIIGQMVGEYRMTTKAVAWGRAWYQQHYEVKNIELDQATFGGYLARKQTHIHKLAMVLAAAESSDLILTEHHLALANTMVTDLEPDMKFVFSKIGKTEDSLYIEKLIDFVERRGQITWMEAYRIVHIHFPKIQDFEAVMTGAIRAGYLILTSEAGGPWLKPGPNRLERSLKDAR